MLFGIITNDRLTFHLREHINMRGVPTEWCQVLINLRRYSPLGQQELGVAAATNIPGARAATSTWKDAGGNVWLFGGYQYDDPSNTRFEMNDLWMYPTAQ